LFSKNSFPKRKEFLYDIRSNYYYNNGNSVFGGGLVVAGKARAKMEGTARRRPGQREIEARLRRFDFFGKIEGMKRVFSFLVSFAVTFAAGFFIWSAFVDGSTR
jgi:hypothetical protein